MNYATELADWIPFLSAVLGGLIVYLAQKKVNLANADSLNVDTFRKLMQDVTALSTKVNDLDRKNAALERKNTALWQYVYSLLDHICKCGEIPPEPPSELESDPKLMAIIGRLREAPG